MATFTGTPGNDSFTGTSAADTFNFAVANLSSGDKIVGGDGAAIDVLNFTTAGTVTANALSGVSGIEKIVFGKNGTNAITLNDALVGSAYGHNVGVVGSDGSDTVDGSGLSAGNSITVTAGGGNDTLKGGAGDDLFQIAAADLTGNDFIAGGAGDDTLRFTAAGTANLANVTGIEHILLANGANSVVFYNPTVASATGARVAVVGGSGNDTIDGSHLIGANALDVTAGGGNDTLTGGAGDDVFRFKAGDLYSTDSVNGGAGTDTLALSTPGTANLVNVRGIEKITLAKGGANTIVLSDAIVSSATGGRVAVTGSSGDDTIDARKLTAPNAIDVIAGSGDDTLLGGAGDDVFTMRASDLTSADTITGGDGTDTLKFVTGSAITASEIANVSGIEQIILANVSTSIALPKTLATTGTLQISAGSGNDMVDGSAISGAALDISAGSGDDTLTGGSGGDTFRFSATGLTSNDYVNGGAGNDTLVLSGGGAVDLTNVRNIESVRLGDGGDSVRLDDDLIQSASGFSVKGGAGNDTIDGTGLSGGTFSVSGGLGENTFRFTIAALSSGGTIANYEGYNTLYLTTAGKIDFTKDSGLDKIVLSNGANNVTFGKYLGVNTTIVGGTGDDTVNAGDLRNSIDVIAGGGTDTLIGGPDNDTFEFKVADLTAADTITAGGTGTYSRDTLKLLTGGTVTPTALSRVSGIEQVIFANADTSLTLNDNILAQVSVPGREQTRTLLITAGAGNDTIDGSQISNNLYNIDVSAGSGNDTLTGGAGNDIFRFAGSGLTADDKLDGGGGANQIVFASAGSADLANVAHVQRINLAAGTNSLLISNGAATSVDGLIVYGSTGDDTIDGRNITSGSGQITYNAGVGNDTIYGGAGDDFFNFSSAGNLFSSSDSIDGGSGDDTLGILGSSTISLSNVRNVETVNLSGDGTYFQPLRLVLDDAMVASAAGHDLTVNVAAAPGSNPGFNIIVDGSGVTSATSSLTLVGGGSDAVLIAGAGTDTLSDSGGTATFEWLHRDGSMDHVLGFDYNNYGDKLGFATAAFDYNGSAFDTKVTASSTATDITGADLVVYTGGALNSVADVQNYLTAAAGGSVDEGLFIAGTNSAGNSVLYHALDASFTHSADVAAIADLGRYQATNLSTGMFTFV